LRVLTFTSLYPNEIAPRHGIFVKNRMDYVDRIPGVLRKVIAPVQYFPLLGRTKNSRFHAYNKIAKREMQGDVAVYHPRYLTLPGTNLINVAAAMARAAESVLPAAYPDDESFDLVDGHYLYPDGVAAHILARRHHKPLFLTARGSDVNFWMTRTGPRKKILAAIDYAQKVICVSRALKDRLIEYGVAEDKLVVLMNGVDRDLFNAGVKANRERRYLLSVGNLVPLKGHDLILRALAHFPDERLIIIGGGEQEAALKSLARQLGLAGRTEFFSHVTHGALPPFYAGAKATILMSAMEGMPNVLLESLACGAPAIAPRVGGIPEVVTEENGILLNARSPESLTGGLKQALHTAWDRRQVAASVAHLDWTETARELHRCFAESLQGRFST